MLTKLLFIILIAHYNTSESVYEIYKRTNHNEKKSNKPKFSLKNALNVFGKYSEMKEYMQMIQKNNYLLLEPQLYMIMMLEKIMKNFKQIGKEKCINLLIMK